MPRAKVQEIARKGGQARAEKARREREDRERLNSGIVHFDDELQAGEGILRMNMDEFQGGEE